MVGAFQDALIAYLNEIVNTRAYLGELSTPEKPVLARSDLPVVLVDFVGDSYISPLERVLEFNLYIVHMSWSKNRAYRDRNEKSVLALCEQTDRHIHLVRLAGCEEIRLQRLQKIYDAASDAGYLCVYMRTIKVVKDYSKGEC